MLVDGRQGLVGFLRWQIDNDEAVGTWVTIGA